MVSLPVKTHGPGCPNPFIPVKAVLEPLLKCGDDKYPNMKDLKTTSKVAGTDDAKASKIDQLDPNGLSPAVLARGMLFHYAENNRLISVREAAALMSIPYDYEFLGGVTAAYKQVGNGVPVELASAVARTIKPVLKWVYEEEESELGKKPAASDSRSSDAVEASTSNPGSEEGLIENSNGDAGAGVDVDGGTIDGAP